MHCLPTNPHNIYASDDSTNPRSTLDDSRKHMKKPRFFRRFTAKFIWIPVGSVKIGMFVSGLDRPWVETPFPLQGLYVKSMRDIERLRLYCDRVEVDVAKSWVKVNAQAAVSTEPPPELKSIRDKLLYMDQHISKEVAAGAQDRVSLQSEIANAKKVYSCSTEVISTVIEDIRNNRKFDYTGVQHIALEMVESVLRNSDALIWLTQLRNKDDYTYQHSINVSILMMNMGKHLALTAEQLLSLGTIGLLQDVGILTLPQELIQKKGSLTSDERELARSHVKKGIELLAGQPGVNRLVLEGIAQHHERYDGSGYPNRLKENQISLFGSIAGIADCYDAIVSERAYASAKSSFQALMLLYELRGSAFNPAVVERYIQSIGIYPIGSIVELNSGEVAIVLEQRKSKRLQPKLLVVLDAQKKPLAESFIMDLLETPLTDEGIAYSIKDVLGAGSFGIDPAEYYLFEGAELLPVTSRTHTH